MLKKHSQFFKHLLFISDLLIISFTWMGSYYLRFHGGIIPVRHTIPPVTDYLLLILPILFIWGFIFRAFDLYRPRRLSSRLAEFFDISRASTLATLILIAITYLWKKAEFSRAVFVTFWLLSILGLTLSRALFREVLRFLRRKGYNLRHAIIVGDGLLARDLMDRFRLHPELGMNVVGLLSRRRDRVGKRVHGKEVIGIYNDIDSILERREVDYIFIALPFSQIHHVERVLKATENHPVTVKIVPDVKSFLPLCGGVEDLDGLPILSLQDSPLYGWNVVVKRGFDVVFSLFAICVTLPLMAIIAIGVKLSSPGPVLYRQRRAGLDGKVFEMLKFRTMHVDAEKDTGPVWARENDPRRTRFGAFLRKTSLDELPQFFNVLKGDMSVVGPRPERPEFIERFRREIPRYMLRHKVKAGITGWAQVNGWRGNTDLKKRIEHDLYYIEHWSLWFDLKIIWLTLWKGLVNKHAY